MPWRCDLGSLRPAKRLADGRIRCDAYISRSGVFVYVNADGTERREWRPPEEVFHPDALDSFHLVPVTDDHPKERITADNAKKYAVGATGEAVRDGMHVRTHLTIYDAPTIKKMDEGKLELSSGYFADLEDTAGTSPDGERYDAIQRNIRGYNGGHVALVDMGRAGPTVHARVDESQPRWDSAIMKSDGMTAHVSGIEGSGPRTFISVEGDLSMTLEELQKKLTDALTQVSELTVKHDTAVKALDVVTKDRDAEKSRADKAEADRDENKAKLDEAITKHKAYTDGESARISARVELVANARRVMGAEFKADGLTDRQVKEAIIKKIRGDKGLPEGKSDDYVDARYESSVESFADGQSGDEDAREAVGAALVGDAAATSKDPEYRGKAASSGYPTRPVEDSDEAHRERKGRELMSPIQDTYPLAPGLALPGMRYDTGKTDDITMINTHATDQIGFGMAVGRNPSGSDKAAMPLAAITNLVAGILERSEAYAKSELGTLGPLPGATLNVMRWGRLWVICENGCTRGQRLFIRAVAAGAEVPGALRSAADSTDTIDASGCGEWMSTAAAGALAVLDFDFRNPLT